MTMPMPMMMMGSVGGMPPGPGAFPSMFQPPAPAPAPAPSAPLDPEAAAAAAAARIEALSSRLAARGGPGRGSAQASQPPSDKHTAEVGINHCRADIRQHLTKTTTHEEIRRETGATVTTKGVYVPVGEIPGPDQKPLFLLIEADSNEAVEAAKQKILTMSKSQSPLTSVRSIYFLCHVTSAFGMEVLVTDSDAPSRTEWYPCRPCPSGIG
jgi:hypothetical protein